MLQRFWLVALCASFVVLAAGATRAQEGKPYVLSAESTHEDYPPPIVPEAAKADLIRKLLQGPASALILSMPASTTAQDRAWCTQFLEDFRAQRNIVHVEPAARAERYGDRVFEPWRRQCPRLAMNISDAGYYTMLYERYPNLPHWMPDGSLLPGYQYGTRNFKLYRVDIDNDAENGEEVVFYSERAYSYWELIVKDDRLPFGLPPIDRDWNAIVPPETIPSTLRIFDGAYYRAIDTQTCASGIAYAAPGPYDFIAGHPVEGYTGIVTYQGKNYLFSLDRDAPPDVYELRLATVQISFGGADVKRKTVCSFLSK